MMEKQTLVLFTYKELYLYLESLTNMKFLTTLGYIHLNSNKRFDRGRSKKPVNECPLLRWQRGCSSQPWIRRHYIQYTRHLALLQ